MRSIVRLSWVAVFMLALTGCERYAQRPLQSEQILADVERMRRLPDAMSINSVSQEAGSAIPKIEPVLFSFPRAVALMKNNSPTLKELRAEYDTVQALADVKTPLPNPTFEAGPLYGFGPKVSHLYRLQPFGSLGFTIPTGKRLQRQDELNCAMAELAYIEIQAKHRELYLELRKDYTRLALVKLRIDKRIELAESAAKSTSLTKKMIEAGFATELDAGLIELEQLKLKTEVFTAKTEGVGVNGELSQMIGVHADNFSLLPSEMLPKLSETLPSLGELQKLLVNNHPELARLRAKYEVAERGLHLELSKQYPDFKIGPKFENERGERKTTIGLTLGIDLPIFDHNQQGIASAKQRRDEIRIKYEAAANRTLAALDRAHANCKLSDEKLKFLITVVAPRANGNIELARKAKDIGASDTLRFLETERGQRTVLLDALDSELSLRNAWIELEQAVGYPLTTFPGEILSETPALEQTNGTIPPTMVKP